MTRNTHLGLVLVLALAGCGPATPTPAPALVPGQRVTVAPLAASTPAPQAGVPIARATFTSPFTPTPTPDFLPTSLGADRRAWEDNRRGDSATPTFTDERVSGLTLSCGCTLDSARLRIQRGLVPPDTRYMRTDTRADGSIVDVFASPSLRTRLPGAPETFSALYAIGSLGIVDTLTLMLGEPPAVSIGVVGQAIESGGVSITASAPRRVPTLPDWGRPADGRMFVVVDVVVRTVARDSYAFYAREFGLRDAQGRVHTPTIGKGGTLFDVTVPRGGTGQGNVSFELPTDATGLLLTFRGPGDGDPIRIALGDLPH